MAESRDAGAAMDVARFGEEPAPPATVGRFEVRRTLGHGGMGVVYEAYDATLDRRVALKLVRFADDGAVARARLLREAQAMAKVADAHVVPVYEVGEHGDEVFIAMELVEGETLASWLARAPRTWREALGRYIAAGRGLAAAHARGVVHRDFKPDNVIVGTDGRPRVLDFGLAQLRGDATRPAESAARAPGDSLTVTGALMGTPSYMSPEHFRAQAVDARSDQFCFGVTLYRALFGVAPFEGTTLVTLGDNVCSGAMRPPPRSEVPPVVIDAVTRALSPDPESRFPSMDALLAELEKPLRIDPELDPARGRRGRRVAVLLLGLASLATLATVVFLEPPAISPRAIVWHAVAALATLCVLGVVFRDAFRASAHNRRVGLVFLVPCAFFVVHRLVALHFDAPVPATLVGDVLALGAVGFFGGITVERWLLAAAPLALAYAAIVSAAPRYAAPGFGVVVLTLVTTAALLWGEPRMRVRRRRDDGGSGSSSGSRTKR
jgi:serine/threonine-protein kinase